MTIDRIITATFGWAANVFQPVERDGPSIPGGPVLIVANHPNALLDPLVIFRIAGRTARPLAKEPLFRQFFIGALLRGLGGLPVYRPKDDPAQTHRNDETFAAAVAALHAGDVVQIYPEGQSHSEPALTPLRTGAARIALRAEAERDWSLGLHIVPVGLTYQKKSQFRGRVLALVGEPFTIGSYRASFENEEAEAVRALTAAITRALESVTLNLSHAADAELVDMAERLYVREKGHASWRERDPLSDRLPRLQAFARGLAWLRAHDAARLQLLAAAVRRYGRYAKLFGAHHGDVPPAYQVVPTTRYVLIETAALVFGLPLAVIGGIVWYPSWIAPYATLAVVKPTDDAVSTYKLATGLVMVPLTLAVVAVASWLIAGPLAALAGAAVALVSGFAAIAWRERWDRVRDDTMLFLRVLTRTRERRLLAEQRASLVAEFDAVAALMDAATADGRAVSVAAPPTPSSPSPAERTHRRSE